MAGLSSCANGGGGEDGGDTSSAGVSSAAVAEAFVGEGSSQASLTWAASATNIDGSPLTDLAGYRVYFTSIAVDGRENSSYVDVGNTTYTTLYGLTTGTITFRVSAIDLLGSESVPSEAVTIVR